MFLHPPTELCSRPRELDGVVVDQLRVVVVVGVVVVVVVVDGSAVIFEAKKKFAISVRLWYFCGEVAPFGLFARAFLLLLLRHVFEKSSF